MRIQQNLKIRLAVFTGVWFLSILLSISAHAGNPPGGGSMARQEMPFQIIKPEPLNGSGVEKHSSPTYNTQNPVTFLLSMMGREGVSDNTSPTVSISFPAKGTKVSGTVTLTAKASDNVAVSSVQFRVDSEKRCAADTPYTCDWDTIPDGDGPVTLTAVATDTSGNQTISAPVSVTIDNSRGAEPSKPSPISSGTIRVPEDHATIQGGVDAAGNGDLVLVGPGAYSGGITIAGKSITLASHHHISDDPAFIDQTTIKGGSPAITIEETAPGTVIKGFRFIGGRKSVVLFANGSVLANHFHYTGKDAISFEGVGGSAIGNVCLSPSDDCIDVDHPTEDVLIEGNIIDSARDDGIEIRNGGKYTGPLVTITIRGNNIKGSGEDGIQLIDSDGIANRKFIIERNLVRYSKDVGLGLMDKTETIEDFRAASMPERVHVFNNTFDGNPYGITGGDNLIAVNNIISNSSVFGIKNTDNNSIVAHTLFWNNATDHTGSNVDPATTFTGDPLHTPSFELKAGSLAIDSGAANFMHHGETVLTIPPEDFSGTAPDLGRYERVK